MNRLRALAVDRSSRPVRTEFNMAPLAASLLPLNTRCVDEAREHLDVRYQPDSQDRDPDLATTPPDILSRLCQPRVAILITLAVVLAAFPLAVVRAVTNQGCDYKDFLNSALFISEYGYRHPYTALNRYLPSVDVAFLVFTLIPVWLGAAIYYLLNVGSWFALLSTVRHGLLPASDPRDAARGTMAAGLLALAIAADGFLIGAFHVAMIWLMVAGLVQASRGRHWRGGLLLGLATWLKLLPVIGIGYLLLKRKWQPALIATLLVIAIDITLCLAAFGVKQSWQEHAAFFSTGAVGTVHDQMHGESWVDEDRITNQSTLVFMRRLLTTRGGFPEMAVADLSPQALSIVSAAVLGMLAAAMLVVFRRPASALAPADWGAEIALLLLCTVWFSPVVWSYHLTAVVPALAVIMSQSRFEISKHAVALIWIVGLVLFTVPLARAAGHMLWSSYLVGTVLLWTIVRNRATADEPRTIRSAVFGPLRRWTNQLPNGGFATSGNSGA
jgi:hypothetical protein